MDHAVFKEVSKRLPSLNVQLGSVCLVRRSRAAHGDFFDGWQCSGNGRQDPNLSVDGFRCIRCT